jgi:hypothetical protein
MIDDSKRLVKYSNAYGQTFAFRADGLESLDEKGWYGIYRFDYTNMVSILNALEIEFAVYENLGVETNFPYFKYVNGAGMNVLRANDDGTYTFGSFFDEWIEIEEEELDKGSSLRAISESIDAGYWAGFFQIFAGDIRRAKDAYMERKIGSLATMNPWW